MIAIAAVDDAATAVAGCLRGCRGLKIEVRQFPPRGRFRVLFLCSRQYSSA